MPIHNFMIEDLIGSLKAICLFPLFILVPGYAIAWLFGVFEFRERTLAFRIALSIPFSISICPIVTYLAGRFGSMNAVWFFYAAAAIYFLSTLRKAGLQPLPNGHGSEASHGAVTVRERLGKVATLFLERRFVVPRDLRIFALIAAVWLAVALFSLIDIQIGDRLYYPVNALDNSIRAGFVHAIHTTGIPPQSPFFPPDHPAPLRYHYFWLMMCSLVERAGVSARQALIAGTFWCGAGLMALVALYLRLFAPGDPARFRRRALTGILLLGITGLDIVPSLFLLFLYSKGMLGFVLPSVEWWNEHVDWFVYSALWAPHALSSLLACLTGFLLLWRAPTASGTRGLLRYSLLGAAALASAIGASIYVSFVFAMFLMVWTCVTVWKKWYRETAALSVAGLACTVLALPYLAALRGPGAAAYGASPLQFTVRAFSLAALIPNWHGLTQGWRLILVNGPLIPLNYLLELGFFFLVGKLQLRKFRSRGGPLSRQELACVVMAATSILICTFLRSSVIGCNDLGWRGFLVAQFVLLLWAVDTLTLADRPTVKLLTVFLILGAAGTVYDLAITRFYPVLADHGVLPPLDWMSPDRQFGKRTYANREAYKWLDGATPDTAAIQFNPTVVFQETTALLYSDRRFVVADTVCNATFGGDPKLCEPAVARLAAFYPGAGKPATQSLADVCQNLPIDLLVAKDTDPVWSDRHSWVWMERPVFANRYMRLFGCRTAPFVTISVLPDGHPPLQPDRKPLRR